MNKAENIVAIIQARLGSSRLPGKVLMPIIDRPMLWHIINRLKRSKSLNKIVIATTIAKEDNPVAEFCLQNNLDFYRGSEDNVLDRYYQAAKLYRAKIIVRITADCPLIDPEIVDKVVENYIGNAGRFDGSSNVLRRTYPLGLDTEVIPFSILEKLWKIADKGYHREHVTVYLYEHPELFKLSSVENSTDLSHLRWTVDEEADLRFIREIYQRLYQEGEIFLTEDILRILSEQPSLLEINKDVRQKRANESSNR